MKVLLVKLTSMGDVIHALPAISDAIKVNPSLRFDWMVEDAFVEIPRWHSAVEQVIPVATRRWRKQLWDSRQEIKRAYRQINSQKYDVVIDAQGLLKSAVFSRLAKGPVHGFDRRSSREPISGFCYHKKHSVSPQQHAILRVRTLFAESLGYPVPTSEPDYQVCAQQLKDVLDVRRFAAPKKPYLVFLHGTTWLSKHWPEQSWQELSIAVEQGDFSVYLPWGNAVERDRAERIAEGKSHVHVLPKMGLTELALLLDEATGVVAVDTGLGHLSAALGRPTVSIYGPTNTQLIGTVGENQRHLIAQPATSNVRVSKHDSFDYATVSADVVWQALSQLLD
ncbi:MAG: lipopolysaccharide heptosyltransferase I [Arenicella sp.]